jgi:hypothetical protein
MPLSVGFDSMSEKPSRELIRQNIVELLALLADAEAQRRYERNVPIANVPAELLCMWFDDLYHPDDAAFVRAFSTPELAALEEFNRTYRSVADELEPLAVSVGDLHAHPSWSRVSPAASAALKAIDGRRSLTAITPRLFQRVRLREDILDARLPRGARGSIIDLNPADPQHVEVEFHLEDGSDLGRWAERIVPLSILELEAPTPVALFVERLVAEVPALQPLLSEHLDFNHELLAHVLFGDVTRFVVSGFAEHPERRRDADKILILLEEALGSPDEDVQNLVSVSFCENLLGEEPLEAIRAAMGPRLRAELATYEQR